MKKDTSFLISTIKKITKSLDIKLILDPVAGRTGMFTFSDGRRHFFTKWNIGVNKSGSRALVGDKALTDFFLKKMKYPVIPGKTFYFSNSDLEMKKNTNEAFVYAEKIGYPLIIKPSIGSWGRGVQKIHNKTQLKKSINSIFNNKRAVIIQKFLTGSDCRILIYKNSFICAYIRKPLCVTGDGKKTIEELVLLKKARYHKEKRHFIIEWEKISSNILHKGKTLKSILIEGESLELLDNANLSAGGDAIDVTDSIHSEYIKISKRLTKDVDLSICGVDLMIDGDIDKKPQPKKWHIIELNATPGLDHFSCLGKRQKQIATDFFKKVITDIRDKRIS